MRERGFDATHSRSHCDGPALRSQPEHTSSGMCHAVLCSAPLRLPETQT